MGRYPKSVRDAAIKCVTCNAPVAETVSGAYACVDCGESPISAKADLSKKRRPADD